jgi:uncharacterized lipoprotein YehR (DUF1307 family)
MKKTIANVALASALMTVLAGCGENKPENKPEGKYECFDIFIQFNDNDTWEMIDRTGPVSENAKKAGAEVNFIVKHKEETKDYTLNVNGIENGQKIDMDLFKASYNEKEDSLTLSGQQFAGGSATCKKAK